MKEWQRWESMAGDFRAVGDHHREAECLDMALSILPPGHRDDKARLKGRLDDARSRDLESGGPTSRDGQEEGLPDAVIEGLDALHQEDARVRVVEAARRMASGPEGGPEAELVRHVADVSGLDMELVQEALEDLLDEGVLVRGRPGRLMMDTGMDEADLETAVLGELSELGSAGRGASRREVVRRLTSRGLARDEVEEAINELEESGRLEEDHPGQLRPALDVGAIDELHHQVAAAVEEMDAKGTGVMVARVERAVTARGWEIGEVREALEELVDAGELLRDGSDVRLPGGRLNDDQARRLMLEVLHALAEDRRRPVPLVRALRAARSRGMGPALTHRILDDLVDSGLLWRDQRGIHLPGDDAMATASTRDLVLRLVRELVTSHMGAPRVEVMERAMVEGLGEAEALEVLEGLIDDGLLHDAGGGFLKPG